MIRAKFHRTALPVFASALLGGCLLQPSPQPAPMPPEAMVEFNNATNVRFTFYFAGTEAGILDSKNRYRIAPARSEWLYCEALCFVRYKLHGAERRMQVRGGKTYVFLPDGLKPAM